MAAGLERYSNHPIARAILDEAGQRGIPLPRGTQIVEEPGQGISGQIAGRTWKLRAGEAGQVRLIDESGEWTVIELGDAVRPDSAHAVGQLVDRGLDVALLTGDHKEVAERIAWETGIATVVSRIEPLGKAAWVENKRRSGHTVLFAGDGINDGPALAEAQVGIAMGGGAASSVLVADGVISSGSLAPIPAGFMVARACASAIRLNQVRSIAYNIVAVGAAALGFVNPLVAAVLMPLSSAMVIWGASRVEVAVRRQSQ